MAFDGRKGAGVAVINLGAEAAQRNAVFRLAGDRAGVATRAALDVDGQAPVRE